jgi:hypothetical protein
LFASTENPNRWLEDLYKNIAADCQRILHNTSRDSIRRNDLKEALRYVQEAKEQKGDKNIESRSYLLGLACKIVAGKLLSREGAQGNLKRYYLASAQKLFEIAHDLPDSKQVKKELDLFAPDNPIVKESVQSDPISDKLAESKKPETISEALQPFAISTPEITNTVSQLVSAPSPKNVQPDLGLLVENGTIKEWEKVLADSKEPLSLNVSISSESDYYGEGYRNLLIAIYESNLDSSILSKLFYGDKFSSRAAKFLSKLKNQGLARFELPNSEVDYANDTFKIMTMETPDRTAIANRVNNPSRRSRGRKIKRSFKDSSG